MEVGLQVVAELYGCDSDLISKKDILAPILDKIVDDVGLTVLGKKHHQFHPIGVTSFYMLAESHIAIHTWPEHGYVALDIFTCGDRTKAIEATRRIATALNASRVKERVIVRGIEDEIEIEEAVAKIS